MTTIAANRLAAKSLIKAIWHRSLTCATIILQISVVILGSPRRGIARPLGGKPLEKSEKS
jgi:hypothetical protein